MDNQKSKIVPFRKGISIRSKIILPYLLVAIALALGAVYVISQIVLDSIEERFINQLIEAGKISSEEMVREEYRLLSSLRLLAYTDGVAEAINTGNAEALRELTLPSVINSHEETVEFLDYKGDTVLSMVHSPAAEIEEYSFTRGSKEFANLTLVKSVLQETVDNVGDKYGDFIQTSHGKFYYISGPIFDEQGDLVGVILVGESTTTLARHMREQTLAAITFYQPDGQVISSTFAESPAMDPPVATSIYYSSGNQSHIRDLNLSNIAYSEILGVWKARGDKKLGIIGVSFAKNFIVRVSRDTWPQILALILGTLLLVIGFGLIISNHISKPIVRLQKAASEVASGNLSVQVDPSSGDEIAALSNGFNTMVARLYKSKKDLISAYDTTIEGWAKTLEFRDAEIKGHSQRVSDLTLKLAHALDLQGEELGHLRRGAFLHDIGKLVIPDSILHKPGPLTPEEMRVVQYHPTIANEILKDIQFLRLALDIPYCHHERWNGSGYPRGLQGEQIPLAARIFAIVDVWDAVLSDREYRPAMTHDEAIRLMWSGSGVLFDPRIIVKFLHIINQERHLADEETVQA